MRPQLALATILGLTALGAATTARAAEPGIQPEGVSERRVHLRLDTAVVYGIGGQSFLGAQAQLTAYSAMWNTRLATGSLDAGLLLGYGNEPVWLAPWLDAAQVQGATHRISVLGRLGHTFHLGQRRRAALGVHVYAGLHEWISSYSVTYAKEGVSGSATETRTLLITGAELDFAYRFSRRVGIYLKAGAPFPYQSGYIQTLFAVGAGLTFYLR